MSKKLDLNTFGDSKAEVTVAKILTALGDSKTTNWVSNLLKRISIITKNLSKITDYKHYLYGIIREETFQRIEDNIKDKDLKSYLRNSVTKKLRKIIK